VLVKPTCCRLPVESLALVPALVLQMSTSVTEATRKAAQDTAAVEERLAEVQRDLQEERRKVGGAGSSKAEAGWFCLADLHLGGPFSARRSITQVSLQLLHCCLLQAEEGAAREKVAAEALAAAERATKEAEERAANVSDL